VTSQEIKKAPLELTLGELRVIWVALLTFATIPVPKSQEMQQSLKTITAKLQQHLEGGK